MVHRLLDQHLGAGVHRAGGLVQNQDVRIGEERAADGHQLAFALAELGGFILEFGVIPVGQAAHELVHMAGLGAFDHPLLADGLALVQAVEQVLADRAVEQPGVLQNHAEVLTQIVAGDVARIHAVDGNRPALDLVEAHEQVDQRGLAGAGRADDGDRLAGLGLQRKILDQRFGRIVAELDMVEPHQALDVLDVLGVLAFGHLLGFVQELEDAFGRSQGALQDRGHRAQLAQRLGELTRILGERLQVAQRHRAGEHLESADDHHDHEVQVAEELRDRHVDAGDQRGHERAVIQLAVAAVELVDRLVLLPVGADHHMAGEHLLHLAVDLAGGIPLPDVIRLRLADDEVRGRQQERDHDQRDEQQQRRDRDHHDHGADDREQGEDELAQHLLERLADVVDVVGGAAHHLAAGHAVEVAQRQMVELGLDLLAHAVDRVGDQTGQRPALDPAQRNRAEEHACGDSQDHRHLAEVHALAGVDVHRGDHVHHAALAVGLKGRDGLLLGGAGGQHLGDHALEQHVRGLAHDLRAQHHGGGGQSAGDDDDRHTQLVGQDVLHQTLERVAARLRGRRSRGCVAASMSGHQSTSSFFSCESAI